MKKVAIWGIRLYQRFISPYKGFRCAHAAYHKGDSCSGAVIKIIAEKGVLKGFSSIRQRFADCGDAYRSIMEEEKSEGKKRKDKGKKKDSRCDECIPSGCVDVAHCIPSGQKCGGCDGPGDCIPCDLSILSGRRHY
ncbi:membrane protein insertion efficiency factor YidD [Neptuniibacter sp. QD37_11]|uniref:membrane protein insertion efficiency factor YidD n=1 Tax=Neptuniibacter sp. QD37_11 TaxID=3398209 RepID=UPI0039F5ADDE